jgi:hypothetical protein
MDAKDSLQATVNGPGRQLDAGELVGFDAFLMA